MAGSIVVWLHWVKKIKTNYVHYHQTKPIAGIWVCVSGYSGIKRAGRVRARIKYTMWPNSTRSIWAQSVGIIKRHIPKRLNDTTDFSGIIFEMKKVAHEIAGESHIFLSGENVNLRVYFDDFSWKSSIQVGNIDSGAESAPNVISKSYSVLDALWHRRLNNFCWSFLSILGKSFQALKTSRSSGNGRAFESGPRDPAFEPRSVQLSFLSDKEIIQRCWVARFAEKAH